MNEREDAKISERYRALGREEPGAALDTAILAAARRAVRSRPGGARTGLRRWTLPVSVAAVVVLSVTVTLQLQRERPDAVALYAPEPKKIEPSVARQAPAEQAPSTASRLAVPNEPSQAATADVEPQTATPGAGRASKPAAAERAPRVNEVRPTPPPDSRARPFAPDPGATPAPSAAGRIVASSPAPAESVADRAPAAAAPSPSRREASAAGARSSNEALRRNGPASAELRAKAGEKEDSPERWLERIVALRAEGRDREADESFAEFRKRYPDYRISEELLGKLGGKR